MTLSAQPLIRDLGHMSSKLAEKKKTVQGLEAEVNRTSDLRKKMIRDLKADNRLDWDNEERRALLDNLYDLAAFQAHERIYCFENAEKALPLLQEIDQYYSDKFDHLKLEKNTLSQKQSNLEQYQQEILRIISQLSQCMSIVNR